ncbi:hypothetical protein [Enterococcus villorum]|uniref:Uncharacterized protein n=2 Tax=Enterococcus villorum TaxID=112904 RepID=A0A511J0D7_9ENTE|nr:hypothetical protein [Enterococcus villorum]EOH87656.1 hypothetical protein UAO_02368 [Enterococcus villorum ATCC 700913]EOW77625.1 hypothetical protein I591_00478 [Enterococcus villorum ATCC 700913]GEL91467.1 hypothetical protein EVI01_08040 [Enterococcus villorum]
MGTFLVLIGLIAFCWGLGGLLKSFIKRKKKKKNLIILAVAFLLMIFGSLISPTPNYSSAKTTTHSEKIIATNKRSNQATKKQKKLEAERKAKEEKQKLEAKRKAKEKKQKLEAQRKAEEEKQKLEAERKAKEQEKINQKTAEATTALEQAEATPTRENYNTAAAAIQAIPNGNQNLSHRLATLDATIKTNESAEAERQRQAAIQAEQTKQAAEAAQREAQAQQQNNEQTVYIAPAHGKKYHFNPHCPGLNHANSVVAISLQEAQAQGYTACKRE